MYETGLPTGFSLPATTGSSFIHSENQRIYSHHAETQTEKGWDAQSFNGEVQRGSGMPFSEVVMAQSVLKDMVLYI